MNFFFALLACCMWTMSLAYYEFQELIPNGDKVTHLETEWPGVGHINKNGGGPRNPFGIAFMIANYEWTKSLCQADSDGDNITNGEELGDPDCVWKMGDTPAREGNITHPGFVTIFDTETGEAGGETVTFETPTKMTVHAYMMGIAWGIIAPLSAFVPFFFKTRSTPHWFYVHVGLMLLVFVMTVIGFGVIVDYREDLGKHFDSNHTIVGLTVFILLFVQMFLGFARPHKDDTKEKTKMRYIWEKAHHFLGRSLLIFIIYLIYSGLDLYQTNLSDNNQSATDTVQIVMFCWAGVLIATFFVFYIYRTLVSPKDKNTVKHQEIPKGIEEAPSSGLVDVASELSNDTPKKK